MAWNSVGGKVAAGAASPKKTQDPVGEFRALVEQHRSATSDRRFNAYTTMVLMDAAVRAIGNARSPQEAREIGTMFRQEVMNAVNFDVHASLSLDDHPIHQALCEFLPSKAWSPTRPDPSWADYVDAFTKFQFARGAALAPSEPK
ncbi:MAG: hypothetical protein ACOZIN_19525 [Myxococcota bacterium]